MVFLESALPDDVGALLGVEAAFGLPLLEAVVVGDRGAIEGGFEVGLGVGAAEEVLAGADLADGVHGLAVFREIDAVEEYLNHGRLVGVHDELFVAHDEAALEPAGGVEHEIDAGEHGSLEGVGGFVGGLGVGGLGGA